MLGSLTRKVLSPCAYWSQARMFNEVLATTFNWYLLRPSNVISVTSISSCILFLHSTLCRLHLGMIFIPSCDTCFLSQSISTMISFSNFDIFDGCVVGIHLYTRGPYLAMCYASKQISYWYMYDFPFVYLVPLCFCGGSVKGFVLSVDLISFHLVALLCGEDYFSHACPYEAFPILIGIPRLY